MHHFGGLKLIFGGFWQCFNIKHYCYLTVLQYFKALILQLIILLIGALRRKLKLWVWQHSELDTSETGRLHVLAFMPPGSGSYLDSSKCRALPNPLVYRSRAYSSNPSRRDVLRASLGGAGPAAPGLWRCPRAAVLCGALGFGGCWSSAVNGPPGIRESTGCFSPGSMGGSALHLAGSLSVSFTVYVLEYIL